MQTLWQDLRYTLRQLRNAPGYAAVAIVTLAFGIGAATAMLAVVDSVLIRPVALPHAEQVVSFELKAHGGSIGFTYKDFEALQTGAKSFSAIASFGTLPSPVTTSAGTRMADVVSVTPDLFSVAGVRPRLGRIMSETDSHASVVVISDEFWNGTLGRNPHIIGSTLKVKDRLATIIGVMPPDFAFPQSFKSDILYVPLTVGKDGKDEHGFSGWQLIGRIKPGVTLAAALAEATAIISHSSKETDKNQGPQLVLRTFSKAATSYEQPSLLALLGACALLLLIACVNSANLQIARAISRNNEMSIRAALGASRVRLLQQIIIESVAVSLFGAGLGLLLAYATLHSARAAYGMQFARFDELTLHLSTFAVCTLLALATGVLAALAPAWSTIRSARNPTFSQTSRITRRSRLSSTLVAVEIALTCVLLVTAGLFLRTFRALQQAPLGFDPQHVTEMTLMPLNPQEPTQALKLTHERLLARLAGLPGVQAAATQTSLPFSSFNLSLSSAFKVAGRPENKQEGTNISLVNAEYARTMGIHPRAGRSFLASDTAGSQPVCMLNEAFVRHFLQGQRVVGKTFEFVSDATDGTDNRVLKTPFTIVGVMPDQISGQSLAERPDPTIFVPFSQFPDDVPKAKFMFGIAPQFAVRSSLQQATLEREIRAALKDTAPDMAEMQIGPLDKSIADSLRNQQLALRLATGFGLVALLLAAVGIYGVLAYSVAGRTREIGIRMALGSSRQGAMLLVIKQAAAMALAGLALGLAGAWPAGRAVRAFLFGVPPFDPLTLTLAALLLLAVCTAAAAIPAYRATQVDPIEALRTE